MRLKIATVLLLAGTVVGCASNPPPPPPAPEPMPAPAPAAPAAMAPVPGMYKGTGELTADSATSCRKPRGTMTARVRGMTILVAGARGTIGPDGAVTGRNLTGTVNGGMADVTIARGKCSIHYTLNNPTAPAQ